MIRRADGRWQERLKTKDMPKPKFFYSPEPTEKKARIDINNQIAEYKISQHRAKHNFFQLCERAIDEKEAEQLEYNTIQMYRYAFKRIPDSFNIDIEDIKPQMVQSLLIEYGKKGYSYSAIHQVKVLFGVVFDFAILNNLPVSNFMRSIKMPKNVTQRKINSPDDEVIDFIKKNAETTKFGLWALYLLATGARIGEANAIQKRKIDFQSGFIRNDESTEFRGNTPYIKKTKTKNSERDIPILEILHTPLKKHCEKLKPNDYVFGGKQPLTKTAIRYNFEKYKKACGYTFTPHQLRHAYAKLLYLAGVDVKTAQGLLGHASIQTTMDIYTDFDNTLKKTSAAMVDTYLAAN